MPLFQKRAFRHALQAHNKIVAFSLRSPPPTALAEATPLNDAVVTRIAASESPLTRELSQLLQTPHFKVTGKSQGFILTHQGSLQLITLVPAYSTPGTSLWKTPLLISAKEVTHGECGRPCDVVLVVSATHCPCYMQCLRCERVVILDFPPVVCPSSS